MENRLDDLFLRFQTKGFMPVEIPGFIKDVFNILGQCCPVKIYQIGLNSLN